MNNSQLLTNGRTYPKVWQLGKMVLTLNNVILSSTLRIRLILIRMVSNEEKIDNCLENQR